MRRAVVLIALAMLSACAPRSAPPVVTTPKFPAFPFPVIPAELQADRSLAERHQSAWNLLQSGELRGAERAFRTLSARQPSFFPGGTGLGYVMLARREFDEALETFDRALLAAPEYAPALAGRGEALAGLGRAAEATASFEAALAADPSLTGISARIEALRFKTVEDLISSARRSRDAGRAEDARQAYERAIRSSPQSGFLYRELAAVEQQLGQLDSALVHARRGAELDPDDARAHVLAGEILESRRAYDEAAREYEAAAALEPDDSIVERVERARAAAALAALPPEYRAIPTEPAITRAQLAALIGVRLEPLVLQAPRRPMPVMTDTRESWAAPWINTVVRAGIMDAYPNHTFQPAAVVRRSDLAHAVSRLLGIIGNTRPGELRTWSEGRPRFLDLPPAHLGYAAAAMAVAAGVLQPLEGNTFQPARPVSGGEAVAALERLEQLAADGRAGR